MTGCSAPNCSNATNHGFRLFRFPTNENRRNRWIINSRRTSWTPGEGARLCEVHFEDSQFEQNRADGWKKLKADAVPTLFDVPNLPQQLKDKRTKGIGVPKPGSILDNLKHTKEYKMGMCFVPDCNHYSERDTCSFFRFPKNEKCKDIWIRNIKRADRTPTSSSRVCSCHFESGDKGKTPTIFERNENKILRFTSPEKRRRKSFPKDPIRRKIRTLSIGRQDFVPSGSTKICSKHFSEDCFDTEKFGGHWLKPTAVPTIFDFTEQTKSAKRVCRPVKKVPPIVSYLSQASNSSSGMERWAGRVALVTGASAGIGEHLCRMLVEHGMIVVGCARRVEKIQAISESLKSSPGKLYAIKCDLSKEDDILNMFETIRKEYEQIDVLINNAGFSTASNLLDGKTDEWRSMLDVNVLALCICTREAVKLMQEKNINDGQIIHISSMSGHRVPPSRLFFYSGTKFMARALTEGLRKELKALKSHIRVASISPGLVETEFAYTMLQNENKANELYSSMACLKPEDIADAVSYILSTSPHVDVNDILIRPVEQVS